MKTETRFMDVPDGYLYYEVAGAGPDVVLFNPGAANLRMWGSTRRWLEATHRVTTWDYRDTGLSSRAVSSYSEIDFLAAVLSAAGIHRAVLIGCSDGGRRALAFAHRHPSLVALVVAVGATFGDFPHPTPEEADSRERMRGHLADRERAWSSQGPAVGAAIDIDGWGSALGSDDRRRMIGYQLANSHFVELEEYLGSELQPPIKNRLHEVSVPVHVLVGDRDFASTQLWAQRIVREIPDSLLEVLPGADHFPMLSSPSAFESAVLRTLTEGAALQLGPLAPADPPREFFERTWLGTLGRNLCRCPHLRTCATSGLTGSTAGGPWAAIANLGGSGSGAQPAGSRGQHDGERRRLRQPMARRGGVPRGTVRTASCGGRSRA